MMMRPLACALLVKLATSQQLVIPGVTDGGGCDLCTLPERVQQVDELCCFETAGNPGARCAGGVGCDVPCAEKLLPLLSNCHPVLDKLFDADDGSYDGIASKFDSVYGACMAMDPVQALVALSDLKDSGQCTDAQLDGVAETPVSAPPCVDERLGCANLISGGFMTCAADFGPNGAMPGQCDKTCAFCNGPPTPPSACDDLRDGCSATLATGFVSCDADFCPTCPMANQCDKTCNLCSGRHRMQTAMQCDLVHFREQVVAVDAACCDDRTTCATGVPTTCDAKCAMVFPRFFETCGTVLHTQVDETSFSSYERLHDTCTTGLPVEPLLRAAAMCSAGSAIAIATMMIIVIGGYEGSSSVYSSGERYDPVANAWSPIASMGTARVYATATVIDGLLYAIGGSADTNSVLSSGERYDPVANAWSPIASMGTGRDAHAAAVIDGLLYAIGGYDGSTYARSGERYDPASNAWSPIASMGTGRDAHVVEVIDDLLYAVGGYDGSSVVRSGERYDPAANAWSPIASMGTARVYATAAVIDGLMYVIGGYEGSSGSFSVYSSGERYDPAANAWSPIASMGTARYGHGVAVIDGLMYAIGGYNGGSTHFIDDLSNGDRLSSGERYNPASNAWSPIASMGTARVYPAAVAL
eukprot:COSAG02_NODE_530_length_20697_cov_20.103457_21_plen_642_part_00